MAYGGFSLIARCDRVSSRLDNQADIGDVSLNIPENRLRRQPLRFGGGHFADIDLLIWL